MLSRKRRGEDQQDAEHEPLAGDERDREEEAVEDRTDLKDAGTKPKSVQICLEKKDQKVETELSGKEAVIDKELLEAFRFFYWNQTGYIRIRLNS